MNIDYVEELFRSVDPGLTESASINRAHEDEIWGSIAISRRPGKRIRTRRFEMAGALVASVTAVAIVLTSLGSAPTNAVGATLKAAAVADSNAASLPTLSAGEYYYQESEISLTCEVSSPLMPAGEAPLTYIADGTMQSWTTTQGTGEVVITPSSVNGGGSHFATPNDEARWVALGKPFIPCALVNSMNQLSGNSANLNNEGSLGGYSSSVSGYGGFGLSLALASRTNFLSATTNVNNLPASPAAISSLLANGQIGTDGSESTTPQVCPILDGSNGAAAGCTPSEQLDIIEQLIQLPDASAKLGAVLYQVLAELPGAELVSPDASLNGAGEAIVEVPQGSNESFEVALNPMSGALVSCSELLTQNGTTTSEGSVRYGTVQVVQGEGSNPSSTSNS